jgi:hypothetical protein
MPGRVILDYKEDDYWDTKVLLVGIQKLLLLGDGWW